MQPPPTQESAEELLERISAGCQDSFRKLHDRFADALLGIATGITRDHNEARDVVQDSLLCVWKNSARYDPCSGKVSTWLFTITRNRAIDHLRKKQRTAAMNKASSNDPCFFRQCSTPDKDVMEFETEAEITLLLANLSNGQKQLLVYSYFDDMSQSEIAEKTGVPLGTVKTRVRKALKCMRVMVGVPR